MKKPVLVVMAAGMGSRYGGLKQIDPVDKEGHIIMDFSIYDAVQAGFRKVVFIIKKENEADFRSAIGDRLSNQLEVSYVFQDLHNIPEGYEVPEGRVKPWGTGHAVLSCINEIDGPFVVINADDYYGSHAFKMAYDFLTENEDTADTYRYMMVGYKLENTLRMAMWQEVCALQMKKDIFLRSTSVPISKSMTAAQLIQKTMEKHGLCFRKAVQYP